MASFGPIRFLQTFSDNLALIQYYDCRHTNAAFEYRNSLDEDCKFRLLNIDTFTPKDFASPAAALNAITRTGSLDPTDTLGSIAALTRTTETEPTDSMQQQNLTFMIRNIPNKYSQAQLLSVLDQTLVRGKDYDFLYLRMDFVNKCNVVSSFQIQGYCFINFTSSSAVEKFTVDRVGKRWPHFNSERCAPCQSLMFKDETA